MSDTTGDDKRRHATLSLKPSWPRNRSAEFLAWPHNSVVVETKKRRIVKPGEEKPVFAPKTEIVTPPPAKNAVERQLLRRRPADQVICPQENWTRVPARWKKPRFAKSRTQKARRRRSHAVAKEDVATREGREAAEGLKPKRPVKGVEDEARAKKEEEEARIAAADASASLLPPPMIAVAKKGAGPRCLRPVEAPARSAETIAPERRR